MLPLYGSIALSSFLIAAPEFLFEGKLPDMVVLASYTVKYHCLIRKLIKILYTSIGVAICTCHLCTKASG